MRKLSQIVLFTTAITALAIGLSTTPSGAITATTWTVTPGGNFSGSAGAITFTDTTTGTVFTCMSSAVSGKLKSGSGLAGAKLGTISALSFTGCDGPLGLTFPMTYSAYPYYLNAKSYDATSSVTTATVTGMHADMNGPGCIAVIDGTGDAADNGAVTGKYTNSTDKLKIVASGSTLHFYDVSGCFGLFDSGDSLDFIGSYTITPAQTITSP